MLQQLFTRLLSLPPDDIKIKVEVNEEHCVENMEGCDSGQLSGDRPLDVDGIKTETDNSSESSELKSDDGKVR